MAALFNTLQIQQFLLAHGYTLPRFGADGKMGPETRAAIKAFQGDHRC